MTSGILSDRAILAAVAQGDIEIDPFQRKHLNTASYDLTLGDEVAVYNEWAWTGGTNQSVTPRPEILDVRDEPSVTKFRIDERGWVLRPGVGYLMHTRERVYTKKFVPVLDGKSSLGRLFVQVHATAGYGDPGFNGQYTLEVIVTHPIHLYAGMRIAQIRFHTLVGDPLKTYDGNYTGDAAKGPVPSRAWRMFR